MMANIDDVWAGTAALPPWNPRFVGIAFGLIAMTLLLTAAATAYDPVPAYSYLLALASCAVGIASTVLYFGEG